MADGTLKDLAKDIRTKVGTDAKWAEAAIKTLYRYQTGREQTDEATEEDNGVGFTGVDAGILTSFAKYLLGIPAPHYRTGIMTTPPANAHLSPNQLKVAYKKLPKYAMQLARIAQAKSAGSPTPAPVAPTAQVPADEAECGLCREPAGLPGLDARGLCVVCAREADAEDTSPAHPSASELMPRASDRQRAVDLAAVEAKREIAAGVHPDIAWSNAAGLAEQLQEQMAAERAEWESDAAFNGVFANYQRELTAGHFGPDYTFARYARLARDIAANSADYDRNYRTYGI